MLYESRDQIPEQYKWHLQDIIKDNNAWEELFFKCEERIGHFAKYQDKLSGEDTLFDCLEFMTRMMHDISYLYGYAKMRLDQDSRDATYQGMSNRADMLYVKYVTATSFITPEISEFSMDRLNELQRSKRFKDYDVFFKEIIRNKDIILSKKEEKLLGEVGLFSDNAREVFSMFDNADVKFAPVKDENGNEVAMSHGVYGMLLQSPDQRVRKDAFDSMFTAYKDHINTIAANYAGNVKKDWFYAKVRGFKSSLDYSMYNENVPSTCYNKLLEAVGKGTKPLHGYIALRKKVLGLDTLNMYDLYTSIVNEQELARREFLAQLTRGDLAGGVGAADTRGHAHEQHVLPRLQHRGQHIEIALRRDLRGRDLRPAAHLRIKGLRVEGIEVQTGLLISVRVEGEGNDRDMLLLQIRSREIGRGIGYDSKHDVASFCM